MKWNQLRTVFIVICSLQFVITLERQIFDFLGYLWIPIITNFLNILALIFGIFGALQKVNKYLYVFVTWCVILLVWNAFLICFYLNVGGLNREQPILSLDTGGVSWWEINGFGCQPTWGSDLNTGEGSWTRPTKVKGCLIDWYQVELVQVIISIVLTCMSLICAVKMLVFKPVAVELCKEKTIRHSVYSVELGAPSASGSNKPMTPRRVKRRSRPSSTRRYRRGGSYRNAGYTATSVSCVSLSRPQSARSSYSNFHGARPLSYINPDQLNDKTQANQNSLVRYSSVPLEQRLKYSPEEPSLAVTRAAQSNLPEQYAACPMSAYSNETINYDRFSQNYTPMDTYNYAHNVGYDTTGVHKSSPLPAYEPSNLMSQSQPQAPGPPAYQMQQINKPLYGGQ